MAIPDFQSIMLPLLRLLKDKEEHFIGDAVDKLADEFNLSDQDRRELLPSGKQAIFNNRVAWAKSHLKMADLLEATRRGYFKVTERGLDVLAQNPPKINIKFLNQFEDFKQWRTGGKQGDSSQTDADEEEDKTPEEVLETAYQNIMDNLANDLLQQIKDSPPSFFETIVVELLVKMGYGGSRKDAGRAIGKSGDEGIDGIIKEDRLGLDIIYIQAKRWENTVGRPEIQKFAGALQGQRAKKGIFITTSNYSREAQEFASRIDTKIVLINGDQLAQYMIDYNIGVTTVSNYEMKKIDMDYFIDD